MEEVSPDSDQWWVPEAKKAITDINLVHKTAFYISKGATDWQILDARGAPRFNGEVAEPRPGVRSGKISGSVNIPFNMLVDDQGCIKPDKELAKIFLDKGVDTTLYTINSCGSGVTACVLDLGLSILGAEKSIIYDGSWSEYVSSVTDCRARLRSQTSHQTSGLTRVSLSDCD